MKTLTIVTLLLHPTVAEPADVITLHCTTPKATITFTLDLDKKVIAWGRDVVPIEVTDRTIRTVEDITFSNMQSGYLEIDRKTLAMTYTVTDGINFGFQFQLNCVH